MGDHSRYKVVFSVYLSCTHVGAAARSYDPMSRWDKSAKGYLSDPSRMGFIYYHGSATLRVAVLEAGLRALSS